MRSMSCTSASFLLSLVAALCLLLSSASVCVEAASASETTALNTIYDQFNGANWKRNSNWKNGGDPCSATLPWSGITCSVTGDVTGLALSGNRLTGAVPDTTVWSALTHVTSVDISFNSITGTLTPILSIGSALGSIDCQSNQMSGALPTAEWSLVPNLYNLYIVNNKFSGSIPVELSNLSKLNVMGFSYNQFSGSIPQELGTGVSKGSLGQIFLGGNQLTGSLPDSFSNIAGLIIFAAELNSGLTGNIPSSWQNLPMLVFGTYGTNLSGQFPQWINKWKNIMLLWLNGNSFTGSPFPMICQCTGLTLLDLSNNQLSGTIDPCIGSLSGLGTLKLDHNQFSGVLPSTIGQLINVKTLGLSFNQLTAPNFGTAALPNYGLPRSMVNMTKLQTLALGNNANLGINIDGEEGNPNSGGIEPLSQLPYLTLLDLSSTSLTGNMASFSLNAPGHIFSNLWTSLVELNVRGNDLTGVPSGNIVSAMPIVSKLDVSNNPRLTGNVDDLAQLITVIATGNPLLTWSGNLPSTIRQAPESGAVVLTSPSGVLNAMSCPQFAGKDASRVWQVDASYHAYKLCTCNAGYYGTAPNCVPIPAASAIPTASLLTATTGSNATDDWTSAKIAAFSDSDYGNNRRLDGMDLSYTLGDPLLAPRVRTIYIEFTLNRANFNSINSLLSIYQGDQTLTGVRYAQMRGSDSIMTNVVETYATLSNMPGGTVMTAVVFGPQATINFNSRDTGGQHFSVNYQLSNVCPFGFEPSEQPGVYCEPIPPVYAQNYAIQAAVFGFNGVVLLVLIVLMGIVAAFSSHPVIRSSSPLFNHIILLGLMMLTIAGMIWALVPSSNSICHARGWLTPLSLVIALGSILVKSDRIRRIFSLEKLQKVSLPNSALLKGLALIILPQIALSVAYSATPVSSSGLSLGSGPTAGYNVWKCQTSSGFIAWYAIQIVYICVLLCYAVFNAFSTRNTPSMFNESFWMAGSVYVFLFFGVIFLPLQLLISNNPDGIAIVNGLGLGFAAISLAALLFGSKLYNVYVARVSRGVSAYTADGQKSDMSDLEMGVKSSSPAGTKGNNNALVDTTATHPKSPSHNSILSQHSGAAPAAGSPATSPVNGVRITVTQPVFTPSEAGNTPLPGTTSETTA